MPLRTRGKRYHYQFDMDGKTYCGSTGLEATKRNASAARLKEDEAREMILEGRDPKQRLTVVSFNDAAQVFLETVDQQYQDHPNTAKRRRTSFVSLKAKFGSKPVSLITPGDLEDYKAWRRSSKIKEVTLRNDLHALSRFFQYAMRKNWARENPVREVEMPSDRNSRRDNLVTPEQEKLYFKNAIGALYDLGRLMILQGCRPEELLTLRKENVDVDRRTLTIRKGKTESAFRTLPLTNEGLRILAYRLSGDSPWIFPSPRAPWKHMGRLTTQHTALIERLGLNFVLYDFRHTFSSRFVMGGGDIITLKGILGHSNTRMLERYVHISQEYQRVAMERYEQTFGNIAGLDVRVQ